MTSAPMTRRTLLSATALGLGGVLAACGSSNDESTASATASSPEAKDGVTLTLPDELAVEDGDTDGLRTRARFYDSDDSYGMLDITVGRISWDRAGLEASSQWQAYVQDTDTTSGQQVYVTAYAPQGKLEGSLALSALNSLTVS